jgi:predicted NAD/FAD-binding protein
MNPLSYRPQGLEAIDHNGPLLLFAEHHRSLRRAGEDLIARCHEDNSFALVAEYRVFERQVLEHMRAEEEVVLPAFAEVDPEEAAALLDAHQALRKQLERTALDVELHAIRLESIRSLLAALDEHAKREDQKMYPWAQVHLPAPSREAIAARLFASIRKLAKLAVG